VIDWSDPEPDFIKPQNVVEIRTLGDAMKLLDEYIAAYQEARTAWARLHNEFIHMKARAEAWECIAENTQFFYDHYKP
jgi:hypothetical protein